MRGGRGEGRGGRGEGGNLLGPNSVQVMHVQHCYEQTLSAQKQYHAVVCRQKCSNAGLLLVDSCEAAPGALVWWPP